MQNTFDSMKKRFVQDSFPSIEKRRAQLSAMTQMITEYSERLCAEVAIDFGNRCHSETMLTEIVPLLAQIRFIEKHLKQWIKDESRPVDIMFQSATSKVIRVPLGVVGIMSPWNFPILLSLSPALTAIAGGNQVMIKMSEFTPRTAKLLKEAVDKHLDGCVQVFSGDLESNKQFANLPFDHLFFTGSPRVGSLVMQAAGKNLTPVTLELGGKSPVFAAPDIDVDTLSDKIVWAKSINAGQICIAPDYLLLPEDRLERFITAARDSFQRLYPLGASDPNYTSLISGDHFSRIQSYLDEASKQNCKVIPLSLDSISTDRKTIVPHLIINPPINSTVMQEEIFGPLLPVITYGDFNETRKYLDELSDPLTIYLFTQSKDIVKEFEYNRSSGGLCINDFLVHFAQEQLPFGGVRQSGVGQYHGIEGYFTFTRPRAIFKRGRYSFTGIARAPYKSIFLDWYYRFFGLQNK
ncbi:MAG: Coniferyl aldehyde dehydrogenase [Pseudomonadota bacterium]